MRLLKSSSNLSLKALYDYFRVKDIARLNPMCLRVSLSLSLFLLALVNIYS